MCIRDSASTDETARVIAESIDRDSRFKAITLSQNSGPSVGRNIGMEHATGEFILFLDGDDFYSDDALERLDRELTANSLDMLYFAAQSFYASRKLRRTPVSYTHLDVYKRQRQNSGVLSALQASSLCARQYSAECPERCV